MFIKSIFFFQFWVLPNSSHFSALFDESLKSVDQKLASVEHFKVANLRNPHLRKSTSKVLEHEKLLKNCFVQIGQSDYASPYNLYQMAEITSEFV